MFSELTTDLRKKINPMLNNNPQKIQKNLQNLNEKKKLNKKRKPTSYANKLKRFWKYLILNIKIVWLLLIWEDLSNKLTMNIHQILLILNHILHHLIGNTTFCLVPFFATCCERRQHDSRYYTYYIIVPDCSHLFSFFTFLPELLLALSACKGTHFPLISYRFQRFSVVPTAVSIGSSVGFRHRDAPRQCSFTILVDYFHSY